MFPPPTCCPPPPQSPSRTATAAAPPPPPPPPPPPHGRRLPLRVATFRRRSFSEDKSSVVASVEVTARTAHKLHRCIIAAGRLPRTTCGRRPLSHRLTLMTQGDTSGSRIARYLPHPAGCPRLVVLPHPAVRHRPSVQTSHALSCFSPSLPGLPCPPWSVLHFPDPTRLDLTCQSLPYACCLRHPAPPLPRAS